MSIPKAYIRMKDEQPDLVQAYESLAAACTQAGPLDARTLALVKLGISLGAGLDGGARSHARKAIDAGCTPDEVLHVAHMCAPTLGFPAMMRARTTVLEIIQPTTGKDD